MFLSSTPPPLDDPLDKLLGGSSSGEDPLDALLKGESLLPPPPSTSSSTTAANNNNDDPLEALLGGSSSLLPPPSKSQQQQQEKANVPSSSTTTPTTTTPTRPAPPATTFANPNNKQHEYGKTLDYPGSYVKCAKCSSIYALSQQDISDRRGIKLQCGVCQHSWFQSRERIMNIRDGYQFVAIPPHDVERIRFNLRERRNPAYVGNYKAYIGNIPYTYDEASLRRLFVQELYDQDENEEEPAPMTSVTAQSSSVSMGSVNLVYDFNTGRHRGFAFANFRDRDEFERAIEVLNGIEVDGRRLNVKEAEV